MPLAIAFARTVIFDSALTLFIDARDRGVSTAPSRTGTRRWSILAWTAMGFGVITKGPVAFVLVLFVVDSVRDLAQACVVLSDRSAIWCFRRGDRAVGLGRVAGRARVSALRAGHGDRRAHGHGGAETHRPAVVLHPVSDRRRAAVVDRGARELDARPTPRRRRSLFCSWRWPIPFVFFSISQSKRPQYILPLMAAARAARRADLGGGAHAHRGDRARGASARFCWPRRSSFTGRR